jgi:hypothetical protein
MANESASELCKWILHMTSLSKHMYMGKPGADHNKQVQLNVIALIITPAKEYPKPHMRTDRMNPSGHHNHGSGMVGLLSITTLPDVQGDTGEYREQPQVSHHDGHVTSCWARVAIVDALRIMNIGAEDLLSRWNEVSGVSRTHRRGSSCLAYVTDALSRLVRFLPGSRPLPCCSIAFAEHQINNRRWLCLAA